MDSYDAIREQLRSAQARAQEALRQRLDHVTSALEDAKTAAREAAAVPPDELFPLSDVQSLVDELDVPPPEPPPPGVTLEMLRGLDAARSQSDLLNHLMTLLTDHASRAAVLVFRSQAVSAWSGVGFQFDAGLESWRGELTASDVLEQLVRDAAPIRFTPSADPLLGRWLAGEEGAQEALLVPVTLRGKLMGAVYADWIGSGPWSPDMVQALVAVSCWLIDTLHHRSEAPTAMVVAPVDMVTAGGVAVPPPPEPEFLEIPEPVEQVPAEPEEEIAEPPGEEFDEAVEMVESELELEPELEAEPEFADELEEVEELEFPEEPELPQEAAVAEESELEVAATAEIGDVEFDPSATVQVDLGEVEVAPPEAEAEPELESTLEVPQSEVPEQEAWDSAPAAQEPPPVKPITPPPPVSPVAEEAPAEGPHLTPEEETRHEEARRFARLLVSEIKLYNEREVEKGRAGHDLYQRLKEDVDRSREMYEKRIAPDVRAARDYFHEELVRILADGNPEALGM